MPVTLKDPITPPTADTAKVVAFKVEDNVERWIIIWVCEGALVDGEFVQNEALPVLEFKIEDGNHPLANGRALRKCVECGRWHGLETACLACGGDLTPYDGFTRLNMQAPEGPTMYHAIKNALYGFLTAEMVPEVGVDGALGDEVVLLPTED